MAESIKLDRNALYEQVWTKPMVRLAKEYGISDVGLKNICVKMEIPTPERGYWRRKERGYTVQKKALPKLSKSGKSEMMIASGYSSAESKESALSLSQKEEINSVMDAVQSDSRFHPIVEQSIKSFNTAKADERGILHPRAKKALDLRVSKNALERALTALSRIVQAVEVLGGKVKVDSNKEPKLRLILEEEEVGLTVEEKIARHDHVPTDVEKRKSRWLWKQYDYEPTGKLTVRIYAKLPYWNGPRTTWSDGKIQQVDKITDKILCGLFEAAAAQKQKRIDDEIEAREREIRQREEEEARRLRRLEKQRQKHLELLAQQYDEALRIQRFVKIVEANQKLLSEIRVQDMELLAWLKWAKTYAEQVDPLKYQHWWDIENLVPLWEIRDYTC